ncbi:hypothetical protein D3C72_2372770 [compost metagenome]
MPRRQRRTAGIDDGLRRGEVRLAHFQMDHIMAGRLQGAGLFQNRHHLERGNGGQAF